MPKFKEWRFLDAFGQHQKPEVNNEGHELVQTRLFGRVYEDDRRDSLTHEFDDGHRIITSPVFEINWPERYVKTRSGTRYDLEGNPHEEYIQWLKDNDMWDEYSTNLLPPTSELN